MKSNKQKKASRAVSKGVLINLLELKYLKKKRNLGNVWNYLINKIQSLKN